MMVQYNTVKTLPTVLARAENDPVRIAPNEAGKFDAEAADGDAGKESDMGAAAGTVLVLIPHSDTVALKQRFRNAKICNSLHLILARGAVDAAPCGR